VNFGVLKLGIGIGGYPKLQVMGLEIGTSQLI
jgi:hypothetical protein